MQKKSLITRPPYDAHFEVERKYSISIEEYAQLPMKLNGLGFVLQRQLSMLDMFLPTKSPEEMSRIRIEKYENQTRTVLTRKDWVSIGNSRERRETRDEELGENTAAIMLELSERLHGDTLPFFDKKRAEYQSEQEKALITVSLDDVNGLGEFNGYYMEIEVLVHEKEEVEAARLIIEKLAYSLLEKKRSDIRLSYMQMLMHSQLSG